MIQAFAHRIVALALIVLALHPHAAHAASDDLLHQWSKIANSKPKVQPECPTCPTGNLTECRRFYLALFSKPVVNVTIAIGYGDPTLPSQPNWSDAEYADLIEKLTSRCRSESDTFCGFRQSTDDLSLFVRLVRINGEVKRIELRAVKGSAGPSPGSSMQASSSETARKKFIEGILTGDIVIYDGHSRNGGGPDFYPARRRSDGHIDYAWYGKNPRGRSELMEALSQRKGAPLGVLAMLSCNTLIHFKAQLQRHSPQTRFVLTNRVTHPDESIPSIRNTLDGLFRQKCAPQLRQDRANDSLEFVQFD